MCRTVCAFTYLFSLVNSFIDSHVNFFFFFGISGVVTLFMHSFYKLQCSQIKLEYLIFTKFIKVFFFSIHLFKESCLKYGILNQHKSKDGKFHKSNLILTFKKLNPSFRFLPN